MNNSTPGQPQEAGLIHDVMTGLTWNPAYLEHLPLPFRFGISREQVERVLSGEADEMLERDEA